MEPGAVLVVDVEKPVAGGRMLARHDGQVLLVAGAIPGERVSARIDRRVRGVVYAEVVDVASPSPDRRDGRDWRCGGSALAHVAYPRQLQLKSEILQDALGRIGRITLPRPPEVVGSKEQGYRMRARLHVQGARLGFYREGTHDLCDAAATGQLLPQTIEWVTAAEASLRRESLEGLVGVELAENLSGSERAGHLDLRAGVDPTAFAGLAEGLVGLSAQTAGRADVVLLSGRPSITDVLHVREGDASAALRLRRDVRGFFQGNRFLLERLVQHVLSLVPRGPVVDLYAGVGLFGLSLAAAGVEPITLVEGDPVTGSDLAGNAEPFAGRVRIERRSVESYLRVARVQGSVRPTAGATFVLDPPRTGLSRDAMRDMRALEPGRVVYVSCDVATLARDARALLEAGYRLDGLTAMDLFPNTAHIEAVALFVR